MDAMDVDTTVDIFYQWTEVAVAEHIPRVTLKSKYPPWFDSSVRRALRGKELAHRRRKLSPTPESLRASHCFPLKGLLLNQLSYLNAVHMFFTLLTTSVIILSVFGRCLN